MLADGFHTVILAAAALLAWTAIGFAVSRRLMPSALVWTSAPVFGWALQNAVSLPLFMLVGFSRLMVAVVLVAAVALALYDFVRGTHGRTVVALPWIMFAVAAVLAAGAAVAVIPKAIGDTVLLAAPIFDHSKVAIVDEIARLGVPPGNSFFGDATSRLPYYYLLHFGAAQLSVISGFGGWNADAALTWYSAFSSVLLAMGLAAHVSGRASAAFWAGLLTLAGSARPLLASLTHRSEALEPLMSYNTGLSGLLYQVSWAPQHVMSASCVVLAIFTLAQTTLRISWLHIVTLALLMAAAFESSVWVGGVVLALSGLAMAVTMAFQTTFAGWRNLIVTGALSAVAAVLIASPLLYDLLQSATARGGSFPISIEPFETVGDLFPDEVGDMLEYPLFWILLLPVELPAIYFAGLFKLRWLARQNVASELRRPLVSMIALMFVSLGASWLLASQIAENNDLGWRAILPGIIVLTAFAGAGIARWIESKAWLPLTVATLFFALGLQGGGRLIFENVAGSPDTKAIPLSQTVQMWREVRDVAGPADRVANNPALFATATLWPINISWALLSNRRSCFAGSEFALAFVPITKERREEIDAQILGVFDGRGTPQDIAEMVTQYHCNTVLLTATDGAWNNDPFAASALFRQVKATEGWRIYRVAEGADQMPANQLKPLSSQ
jgi:hypothetical protein